MPEAAAPELSISPEKVCFVAIKAREFDVKDVPTDVGEGSNPSDDRMIDVLEDHKDDPVVQELRGFIQALTEDEQIDLVTLAWLACFLRSGTAREIRWGGYRYLIRGPLDVEAVPLAQAAARTSTSAASR